MRASSPLLVSAFLVLMVSSTSCKVYDPDLVAGSGSPDAGEGTPGDCGERRYPPDRPMGMDDGVEDGPYVWGLKDVTLNQDAEQWRNIGFDIDGRCSRNTDGAGMRITPDVECLPPTSTVSPEEDGEGGIDNAVGHQLLPVLAITLPMIETDVRNSADQGLGVIVVEVRGWNGQPDDPRVDVRMHITVGVAAIEMGATDPPIVTFSNEGVRDMAGDLVPPSWDPGGENWFWSREDMFLMGDPELPFIRDDNAYVAGDTLVFSLPERTDIFFRGVMQSTTIRITGGLVAGTISADRSMIEPVTYAGRWSILDILETVESVGICQGTPQYEILLNLLDRVADVRSNAASGGSGAPCDACSLGVEFRGFRGRFAGIGPVLPVGNACEMMMMMPTP